MTHIEDRFFLLPRGGNGSDKEPFGPDFGDIDGIYGYSCLYLREEAGGNVPVLARVYGSREALDELSSLPRAIDLSRDESAFKRHVGGPTEGVGTLAELAKRLAVRFSD